ncbi:MAG: RNA methyltransferase [Pseudomonadota bacterium]
MSDFTHLSNNIRIVLVGTTHPGNIGSAARAMKVMGLHRLYLAAIEAPFPSSRATALATSADDLLQTAVVTDSLMEAIADCQLVIGTSARSRSLPLPLMNPRSAARHVVEHATDQQVAIVFGREKSGLTNEETDLCHQLINIPTGKEYNSLNLAQAVQVVTYEIFMTMLGELPDLVEPADWTPESAERVDFYMKRLEETLLAIGFMNPDQPKRLMQRLRRLYQRARPDENELNILNGILSATLESARGRQQADD